MYLPFDLTKVKVEKATGTYVYKHIVLNFRIKIQNFDNTIVSWWTNEKFTYCYLFLKVVIVISLTKISVCSYFSGRVKAFLS